MRIMNNIDIINWTPSARWKDKKVTDTEIRPVGEPARRYAIATAIRDGLANPVVVRVEMEADAGARARAEAMDAARIALDRLLVELDWADGVPSACEQSRGDGGAGHGKNH